MRLTVIILLAVFGFILCANISASTYMDWQRFRTDMAAHTLSQMIDDLIGPRDVRQQAFDNCVKLSLAYPRKDGYPYTDYDSWAALFTLCEKYRQESLAPALKNLP